MSQFTIGPQEEVLKDRIAKLMTAQAALPQVNVGYSFSDRRRMKRLRRWLMAQEATASVDLAVYRASVAMGETRDVSMEWTDRHGPMAESPYQKLAAQLEWMARQCDHEGDYLEPTAEYPYGHCADSWCMRCETEKARCLLAEIRPEEGTQGE